ASRLHTLVLAVQMVTTLSKYDFVAQRHPLLARQHLATKYGAGTQPSLHQHLSRWRLAAQRLLAQPQQAVANI
ncbi:MAG: hypothetical protein QG549_418, partial [Patescibacteria group bacterium]|nr:hypothetical protein [Patescibacteria group bacterium]